MPKTKTKKLVGLKRRDLLWVAVIILGLYIIIPQLKGFKNSWHLIIHPNSTFLVLSILFISLTYLAAAATYCLLASRPLRYVEELAVQLAAMFVNRLLPAGIGGIGANYEYLKKKGYSTSESASMVAANNSLGALAHFSILVIALSISPAKRILPSASTSLMHGLSASLEVVPVVLVLMLVIALFFKHQKVNKALRAFIKQLAAYRRNPTVLAYAYLSQVVLSLANIYCLFYAAEAVGVHLSFPAVLLIFTFGSGVRNVVPTPGGIGGFEAGLVAGFVAYKVSSSEALATVLLYRLISYWVPLVLGAAAFVYAESRDWFALG